MKFTLSWLKNHLETTATLEEILYALTDLGLEVEGVEDPADRLGTFKIGYVKAAEKHPDADKLQVCTVETAEGVRQIICGAPNARQGIRVVVAQPGDYIPGIDTTIKVGKIRGVESFGMMCSERELELSDEHDGIIELGDDAVVGQRYIDYAGMNDPVIEIAITPNRPDALGVYGIARDLAARGIGTLKHTKTEAVSGSFSSPITVTLADDVKDKSCPLFVGRYIKGVKNGPSPAWLQQQLRAVGLRPISALVDITNFMTYGYNRPMHVFDADKVHGNITVRKAHAGEKLVALDDSEYTFNGSETVIADEKAAESIGGIMGGLETGCTPETVNVMVEAAYFDTIDIAQTGRRHKINSDARYRNERGIDPAFTQEGMEIATRMILDLCGGEASELIIAGSVPDVSRSYKLDPSRVISLVGMDIPKDQQVRILTDLGFVVTGEGTVLDVAVPSWRPDVLGEADLVEEVARVASLTKLEGKPMPRPAGVAPVVLTPIQKRESTLRRTVAALGYHESVTYSFIDAKAAALFEGGGDDVMLSNPISADLSHMRPSILPGLLQAAARNQARGFSDLALFELGPVFNGGEPDDQGRQVSGIRIGQSAARNAHGTRRPVDLYDAKADAQAALSAIGAPEKLMVMRNAPAWFHPGRSAALSLGPKNPLAVFGELHPKVLAALGVRGPAVAFTVFPDSVPYPRSKTATRPALSVHDLQAVERDFAFVVDDRVEVGAVVKAAQSADKALIENVSVFDVFDGAKAAAQMGDGKKSVAIAVRLQPKQATLTDKDIEAVTTKVIAEVAKATGGALRS